MPPSVMIVAVHVVRGEAATFRGMPSDPDHDAAVSIEWFHTVGLCGQSMEQHDRATGLMYTVPVAHTGAPFCVWAIARDSYGATSPPEPWQGDPENKDPVVSLIIDGEDVEHVGQWTYQSPFALHRLIRMDASATTDPDDSRDDLQFTWEPNAVLVECPTDPSPWMRCLLPDRAGPFTVKLTVSDPGGANATMTRMFDVADDDLPCLGETVPSLDTSMTVSSAATAQDFYVGTVVDDGEPYPQQDGHEVTAFTWFLGPEIGPLERQVVNGTLNAFFHVAPNRYRVGDRVRVRVEIADRNTARSQKLLSDCDKDICASRAGCRQRMTWLITYAL